MKNTKYKEKLEVRLTKDEKNLVENLAKQEGLSKSQYIRILINNKERSYTLPELELENLRKEFAKLTMIGSNINQIAYHLNVEAIKEGISEVKLGDIQNLKELNIATLEQLLVVKDFIIGLINSKS